MSTAPLLSAARAESLRRALVIAAALAGVASGLFVLSSQPAADFLREGPARFLGVEGTAIRLVMGLGSMLAVLVASAALWARISLGRLLAAGAALAAALGLVHVLAGPAATLLVVSVAVDRAPRLTRARLAEIGPRRYPVRWGLGGVAAVAGLVVLSAVSFYLARPLFDEGTRLEEALTFEVAGLVQPEADAPAPAPAAVAATVSPAATASPVPSAATVAPAATATPAATPAAPQSQQGELISRGDLEGADAFHTAHGEVLLVRSPEGAVVLRFQDYEVRNGPGLYVYLTPDPGGDVHAEGAVELSPVRATSGFVNYDVPADLDVGSFRAAVIYCKPFSVTFATAELR